MRLKSNILCDICVKNSVFRGKYTIFADNYVLVFLLEMGNTVRKNNLNFYKQ